MNKLYGTLEEIKDKLTEEFKDYKGDLAIPVIWKEEDVRELVLEADEEAENYFSSIGEEDQKESLKQTAEGFLSPIDNGKTGNSTSESFVDYARYCIYDKRNEDRERDGYVEPTFEELMEELKENRFEPEKAVRTCLDLMSIVR